MMFPGLGNKIQLGETIEIPESIMSYAIDEIDNIPPNSPPCSMMMSPSYPPNGILPEKRARFYNELASLSPKINASECKQNLRKCMADISGIISTVFDVNTKLDEELKHMERRHTVEVNSLLKENDRLTVEVSQLKMEMNDKIELIKRNMELQMIDLKAEHARHILKVIEDSEEKWESKLKSQLKIIEEQHKNEIILMQARHEQKIAQFEAERQKFFTESYDLIERKQMEKERAVSQAVERCKREYETLINDAKSKKYCMACGAGKPLDLYYVCNSECQRRYW